MNRTFLNAFWTTTQKWTPNYMSSQQRIRVSCTGCLCCCCFFLLVDKKNVHRIWMFVPFAISFHSNPTTANFYSLILTLLLWMRSPMFAVRWYIFTGLFLHISPSSFLSRSVFITPNIVSHFCFAPGANISNECVVNSREKNDEWRDEAKNAAQFFHCYSQSFLVTWRSKRSQHYEMNRNTMCTMCIVLYYFYQFHFMHYKHSEHITTYKWKHYHYYFWVVGCYSTLPLLEPALLKWMNELQISMNFVLAYTG